MISTHHDLSNDPDSIPLYSQEDRTPIIGYYKNVDGAIMITIDKNHLAYGCDILLIDYNYIDIHDNIQMCCLLNFISGISGLFENRFDLHINGKHFMNMKYNIPAELKLKGLDKQFPIKFEIIREPDNDVCIVDYLELPKLNNDNE